MKQILEAGRKLEKPAPKEKREGQPATAVSWEDVQAVKSDLQGLVSQGVELDKALE